VGQLADRANLTKQANVNVANVASGGKQGQPSDTNATWAVDVCGFRIIGEHHERKCNGIAPVSLDNVHGRNFLDP
jgi:hypothetical protein